MSRNGKKAPPNLPWLVLGYDGTEDGLVIKERIVSVTSLQARLHDVLKWLASNKDRYVVMRLGEASVVETNPWEE